MTRTPIKQELTEMVDELADHAYETFQPGRAVLGVSIPGGDSIKQLLDDHAASVLDEIKDDMETQIDLVLSYAEDCAVGDDDPEAYLDEFYATNPVMEHIDDYNARRRLANDLGEHFEQLGHDMAPLMVSEEESYDTILRETMTQEEAEEMVDEHLEQIDYFFRYRDAISFTETIGSGFLSKEIDYTDEALRVLRSAQEEARRHAYETISEAYE